MSIFISGIFLHFWRFARIEELPDSSEDLSVLKFEECTLCAVHQIP